MLGIKLHRDRLAYVPVGRNRAEVALAIVTVEAGLNLTIGRVYPNAELPVGTQAPRHVGVSAEAAVHVGGYLELGDPGRRALRDEIDDARWWREAVVECAYTLQHLDPRLVF